MTRTRVSVTTTSAYLSIENNLANYRKLTSNEPAVKTATQYYQRHIADIKSVDQFVSNYRLLSYALQAYGLGDQINNKALIRKVLEQGVNNPRALANTLPNPNWKKFASAFTFNTSGSNAPSSPASVATTTSDYVEQQLEADQGQSDPGVELALYFKRVAPTSANNYGLLADKNLLEVVQTIFGLSPTASAAQIDKEAAQLSKLVPPSEVADPKKLERLVERFAAAYDSKYGPASGNSSGLTVNSGNSDSAPVAAQSILAGVIGSNASQLQSSGAANAPGAGLLFGLHTLALGG